MSKPTVRELLERIANPTLPRSGSLCDAELAAEALAALNAEEARTVVRELTPNATCRNCDFLLDGVDGWVCLADESVEPFGVAGNRPDACPLNDGGRVLVRLAVVE